MESEKICIICQDFEDYVGHETDNCPKNPCQNCGEIGHIKIKCVSWKKSIRLSIENEYPVSKHQNLSTSSFEDLPDEVILRVLSNLEVKDIILCGYVSKRIRSISQDESLWMKINLYSKKGIPIEFLNYVPNCKYFGFAFAKIADDSLKRNASQLKYLDLPYYEYQDLQHFLIKLCWLESRLLHDDLQVKTMDMLDLSRCNGANMENLHLEIIRLPKIPLNRFYIFVFCF